MLLKEEFIHNDSETPALQSIYVNYRKLISSSHMHLNVFS